MTYDNTKKQIFLLSIFFVLTGAIFFNINVSKNMLLAGLVVNASETIIDQPVIQEKVPEENVTTKLNALSAISVEIKQGEEKTVFENNSSEKLPVARLTKLMTALIVLEKYNLYQEIPISKLAMEQEGEQGVLIESERLSVSDLLYIMLIESSNRAAFALAEFIDTDYFMYSMNQKAIDLGMTQTHFEDSTGLNPKSYSTAQDLAKLSKYLFENYPLFKKIIKYQQYDLYRNDGTLHHTLVATNKLLGQYEIVGGKTGWTDEARGCFMVIRTQHNQGNTDENSYSIHIILGADDRFLEMSRLIQGINTGSSYTEKSASGQKIIQQ